MATTHMCEWLPYLQVSVEILSLLITMRQHVLSLVGSENGLPSSYRHRLGESSTKQKTVDLSLVHKCTEYMSYSHG